MNKRQVNQYGMLQVVEHHFENSAAIWGSNILIADTKATFSAKLAQIDAAIRVQNDTSVGATNDKTWLRRDLETKTFFVIRAISAYTSLNPGQKELSNAVVITQSKLLQFRDTDLLHYVERLNEAALGVVANLENYEVTEATLADLMVARSAFYDIMNTQKEVIDNRKDATEAISVLLKEALVILDKTMDKLIGNMQAAQPQFVNVYFIDRKIGKVGSRTLSLEITTLNAADKTPLAGAKIEVVDHHIKRISSQKGQNRVRNLKEANYILSVTLENFVSQLIPFTIISHETTKVVVEMKEKVVQKETATNLGQTNLRETNGKA